MIWLYLILLLVSSLVFYILFLRPKHLKWGANENELSMTLPGDEIVVSPDFNATRAISISAAPEEIWKWIIQIGSGRAGWYSIDQIDNGGKPSSDVILPEFQEICLGQFIPFTPDQKNGMWVEDFIQYQYILWTDKKNNATWLWYIYSSGSATRLITRLRTKYTWNSIWILYYLIYDAGDIIMMKRCMKGIKRRAENQAAQMGMIF